MKLFSLPCLTIAIAALLAQPSPVSAQEETTQDSPAAAADPADKTVAGSDAPPAGTVDPLAEWKRLADRKLEIFNTLQAAKQTFAVAKDDAERRKIRDEFTTLIIEFETTIDPEMIKLADTVWEQDQTNLDAGEIAMKNAFNSNQFAVARDISRKLLAADRRTRNVYEMGATSEFALHNFAASAELLEELIRVHKPRDSREAEFLAKYAADARDYVDLWKKEQVIRSKEDALEGDAALPRVELQTTQGKMVVELFEDHAPNTVASFMQTVEAKKYDGVRFHRVLPTFMAQTGDTTENDDDPLNDNTGPGFTIPCECYRDETRMHFQGSLSMAHAGKDTGGTQFFITHLPTRHLNHKKDKTTNNHTCFGRIIEGMEAVWNTKIDDTVISARVIRKRPHEYRANRILDAALEPDGTLKPKQATDNEPENTSGKESATDGNKEADAAEPVKSDDQKPKGSGE